MASEINSVHIVIWVFLLKAKFFLVYKTKKKIIINII